MFQLRAILLVLVYTVTLAIPVAARSFSFIAASSESTEKESVTSSTFEHRESSSIKITGKLVNTRKYLAGERYPSAADPNIDIQHNSNSRISIPAYILYCVYRL